MAMKTVLAFLLCASSLLAETVRIRVHGSGLEGNLAGDTADPAVTVYLPPSYAKNAKARFPVLYLLHGFTDTDEQWMGARKHFVNVPEIAGRVMGAGGAREMIIVMPNAMTRFQGSMYSTSPVTGDWEGFVAGDLVRYIDSHYRTLARPESRGLAGHSMGGYGTIRIAMRRPGVFSSIYAMSPCCLQPPAALQGAAKAEAVKSLDDIAKADFGTKAMLASAAAWSPNPQNAPLFIDLPVKNGETQPAVLARWAANAPMAMLDQYAANLRSLRAIAIDAGDKDRLTATAREFDALLTSRGVTHSFSIYDGDHVNHVADRVAEQVLGFFSRNLTFEAQGTGR
ncbi:MAG: alpha/beta fold hydrolase [Bryobacterales bacterium]|nr:alpha/beta fold hydrolase [Bryobacterales bacterium]